MKVALIGNMNNNHFAMLRYFHDLGVEAYLFKFANEFDHFQPQCDTFQFPKWEQFIINTEIIDGDFLQLIKLSKKYLNDVFKGFDYYIGNGMAPIYLLKAGIRLDLFLPYGIGIEYTYRPNKEGLWNLIKEKIVKVFQEHAIKNNVSIVCSSEELTIKKALSLGKRVERLSIPMVYYEKNEDVNWPVSENILNKILESEFKLFSHVSHLDHNGMIYQIKRNDILIEAFSKYVQDYPNHKSLLILLSYGNDTEYSKKIIKEKGVESKVVWLPLMMRKDLISIISKIDMGASEFGGYTWGGTGWEFLSAGKLFFHYINMSNSDIEETLGATLPPFINSNRPEYIAEKIAYYYSNKMELKRKEIELKDWYKSNAGINLADKYLTLLKQLKKN
jgi:hypothetical protein